MVGSILREIWVLHTAEYVKATNYFKRTPMKRGRRRGFQNAIIDLLGLGWNVEAVEIPQE